MIHAQEDYGLVLLQQAVCLTKSFTYRIGRRKKSLQASSLEVLHPSFCKTSAGTQP